MSKIKTGYFLSTGLLTALVCMSAGMYIFNNAEMQKSFLALGYPVYIIYPLAIAKILGLIAIWSRKSQLLLYMAYAGFYYNFILALSAHLVAGDGEFPGAMVALILVVSSYITQKKHFA